VLTCLVSTVLALAQAPALDEAGRTLALLRTPEHALKFEGPGAEERVRLVLPLLRAYAELLGWKLVLEPELEAALAQDETGLRLPGELARADVHPLVQSLARARGLCFRFDAAAGETQLVVERVASERGRKAFESPIAIPLELLPAWANHPAFLLCVEIPHAREGSAELGQRLRALLSQSALRTDVTRAESGALRVTGSAAILEFVVETLRESSKLAQGLEQATFPPDPNTPEGKAAAVLPASLRAAFPQRDGALVLRTDGGRPSELSVVREYGRWAARPLLFSTDETRTALANTAERPDAPESVPAAWAHEYVSGLLADAGCALAPLPARNPVLWTIEKHPQGRAVALDPAGVPVIRLEELASVAHLAATRFQTFVRVPKLDPEQVRRIGELDSPDERAPFWITQLDGPRIFSVIGTPRAITSAVLGLRLLLTETKPR
jgi:hypothetical protein